MISKQSTHREQQKQQEKHHKQNRVLVTSALPYANGPIHIGHLVEYIQTDIFVRFLKLSGRKAIYICADDTHGAPIEINASKLGIEPEQLIEKYHKEHLKDFSDFQIQFDSYYSTNSPENKHYSDLFFSTLKNKGLIYEKEIELTYCPNCKRFLPDRYVKGTCPKCGAEDQYGDVCEKCNATYKTTDLIKPYCSICKSAPIRRPSRHYFFRLSAMSSQLKQWLDSNDKLQKDVKNFIYNWIKEGLEDWCISRDGPYFGFKIPEENNGKDNNEKEEEKDEKEGKNENIRNESKKEKRNENIKIDRDEKRSESRKEDTNEGRKKDRNEGRKKDIKEDKYYYVWLDAPIGYVASTENYCKESGKKENAGTNAETATDWWQNSDTDIIHFIGKDIIYFHFLFWPAMLMGVDYNLPSRIVVHGHLTLNNEKMSKSRGTLLTARQYLDVLQPEYLRFYYALSLSNRLMDIDLDFNDFKERINSELVGNIANFMHRAVSFCNRFCDAKVGSFEQDETTAHIDALAGAAADAYNDADIKTALKHILEISALGNKSFQEKEPWKLIKENKTAAEAEVAKAMNIARNVAILIKPILPSLSAKFESIINEELDFSKLGWDYQNRKIGNATAFIDRIEIDLKKILLEPQNNINEAEKQKEKKRNTASPVAPASQAAPIAALASAALLDMRVAEIISAEEHPNADSLYVLQIRVGDEKKQLVAGLRKYYSKEQLIGKKVVMLYNLKPAKLRGVESKGMLLAADDGQNVILLNPQTAIPDQKAYFENITPQPKQQITIGEFTASEIKVQGKRAICNGHALRTDAGYITADIADGAKVR